MSERTLTCAAMPLRADQSAYALVIGTREGMARLLGGQTEKLERRIDPAGLPLFFTAFYTSCFTLL